MIPYGLIVDRTESIANQIFSDFKHQSLVLLCVIKGGYRFFSSLIEKLQSKNRNSDRVSLPLKINFVCLKKDANLADNIELMDRHDLGFIKGKNVLLIENLVDTGETLSKIKSFICDLEPMSVKTCCLIIKRDENRAKEYPDYVGFEIPNRYVVGYALGLNEHFRDLNHVCLIKQSSLDKYKRN
ncbi:hypoxanthine-guanine phosphoribosyltransferase [Brachionus plicatilis]|uniref:Hypoxanthine-guanine phosphoribosyltransferase n=1 Tax=Brachionus plicatilis TaxID=10195 RepID=A0A3M7S886_BRAPC|nr:hypoxanthine-guanine phosphoribosyltransferase [Brachionus plicatilis]